MTGNRIKSQPTKSHSKEVNPSFPSLEEVPIGSTGFSWAIGSVSQTTWSKGSKPIKIFRESNYILNYMYKNQGKLF